MVLDECSTAGSGLEAPADPLIESVLQPMRDLLRRYQRASKVVEHAIEALQGQIEGRRADNPEHFAPQIASLEAESSDVDALLEFQERLSEVPGVLRVTVAGAKSGTSTFIVELAPESARLVVCTNCAKILSEGPPPASHGLCEECRAVFGTTKG